MLLEIGLGIGAHGEERGVSHRYLAGVSDQQHQSESHYGIDPDEDQLRDKVVGKYPRRQQQRDAQHGVPELLATVAEEPDVLLIAGPEQKTHQTFFPVGSPNNPLGLITSIASTTT